MEFGIFCGLDMLSEFKADINPSRPLISVHGHHHSPQALIEESDFCSREMHVAGARTVLEYQGFLESAPHIYIAE